MEQLNTNLKQRAITVSIRDDGTLWLLQKTLKDRTYGARPLRRTIQREIEDQLEYPGQVKVIVIRESRAVEVAK